MILGRAYSKDLFFFLEKRSALHYAWMDFWEADLLVFPVFEDDKLADEVGLDSASGGEIAAALAR